MDLEKLIVQSLGLQGVKLESWEACDKDLKLILYARQDRETASCHKCGNHISHVHEWKLRKIKAAPMGSYEEVWIYLKQLRGLALCVTIKSDHLKYALLTQILKT